MARSGARRKRPAILIYRQGEVNLTLPPDSAENSHALVSALGTATDRLEIEMVNITQKPVLAQRAEVLKHLLMS